MPKMKIMLFINKLKDIKPDLVGFTVVTPTYNLVRDLAERVKKEIES